MRVEVPRAAPVARIAQWNRARSSEGRGRWFDSSSARQMLCRGGVSGRNRLSYKEESPQVRILPPAPVQRPIAQVAEHAIDNRAVGSSSDPGPTRFRCGRHPTVGWDPSKFLMPARIRPPAPRLQSNRPAPEFGQACNTPLPYCHAAPAIHLAALTEPALLISTHPARPPV